MLDLNDPATLKAFLARHGLTADKRLGQHFLCSSRVVQAITERLSFCKGILEIGPGPGAITSQLASFTNKSLAIELDDRMIDALRESAPETVVFKEDALKADLGDRLRSLPEPRGLVSNIPYYITGPLLTKFAEARTGYDVAVLMMQKEVADRVLAGAKASARGSLSVYLQSQFEIEKVIAVPSGAFLPPPKVESTVLQFKPKAVGIEDEAGFFKLARLSFTQPRKTMVNNLVSGYGIAREEAVTWLESADLTERSRPQELDLAQWKKLWSARTR
ncbi:MAG TPA: 16S rRNA (adenine(1518)-N(6)/adenine(1519)-N(6))-dimethyltransferase RsmA [Fimbriimonadaceae bacterium]|nr:16S rRNA (adenine(1518)-N(6)/adenine(1519)-N(6))-dimethyltransferase RsmA [Fimbriimonadaceae bacterium]